MEFLEQIKEMIEVFDPNIFDSKVINDKAELNGTPFVAPEARGGINFIVPLDKEARSEEIVSQDAGLGKAIAALSNFDVDPTAAVTTRKLVLLNEFRWDVGDLDADICRVGHWRVKVEVLEVNGAEARSFAREHTIEQQLEEFKGRSVGANVTRKQMQLPPMAMRVQSGSSLSGRTSQTTMVWRISFCLWAGMP